MEIKFLTRVADPHHLNVDPDPAPYQDDVSLRPLAYRPSRAPFWAFMASFEAPMDLRGSILSL